MTTADRAERILRIYLRGRRMDVGRIGDGDPGREYRVRFLLHVTAGASAATRGENS